MHAHLGSQVFEARFFEMAVEALAPFFVEHPLAELSIGGGLGVAYVEGEEAPTITEWADAVHRASRPGRASPPGSPPSPGASIVAAAAVTLYTVGTIKDLPGIRTYVSVDGGMSDNPRPVLYGSGYETFLARAVDAERDRTVRVVGKHCESGDLLVREGRVPADLARRRRAVHAGHGRLRPLDGLELQQGAAPGRRVRARRRGPARRAARDLRRPAALRGRVGQARAVT